MLPITKTNIQRTVTIPSPVSGLPDVQWVLQISPNGISFRRFRSTDPAIKLSWRELIATGLIHRGK